MLKDILILEGEQETDELGGALAMQRVLNGGTVWRLPGSYGRAAMAMLEAGRCCLGREACLDYWGNRVPSRDEVKAGTKGSLQLVRDTMGDDWADAIEGVQ